MCTSMFLILLIVIQPKWQIERPQRITYITCSHIMKLVNTAPPNIHSTYGALHTCLSKKNLQAKLYYKNNIYLNQFLFRKMQQTNFKDKLNKRNIIYIVLQYPNLISAEGPHSVHALCLVPAFTLMCV